jgi:hypothetical protein
LLEIVDFRSKMRNTNSIGLSESFFQIKPHINGILEKKDSLTLSNRGNRIENP